MSREEQSIIKVLNYVATFDGIISSEDDIKNILEYGIKKFISKKRQHLFSITNTYPIKIKFTKP